MDEQFSVLEKSTSRDAKIIGGGVDHRKYSLYGVGGSGRTLIETKSALAILNDEISKCPSRINGETQRASSSQRYDVLYRIQGTVSSKIASRLLCDLISSSPPVRLRWSARATTKAVGPARTGGPTANERLAQSPMQCRAFATRPRRI
jgi:hypothetical protein